MEFTEVVRRRRMVRAYDPSRPVRHEVVDELLELATHAPSAGFSQGWRFLVLQEEPERDAFWTATDPGGVPDPWLAGMRTAPVLIVVFADKQTYLDRYAEPDKGWTDRDESRWPVPYWHIDAGMASLLMLLTAVDEGLGACFFGIPPERIPSYRSAFGVPDSFTPIGAVSVGYRAADRIGGSRSRGHRPLSDVVHHGHWPA